MEKASLWLNRLSLLLIFLLGLYLRFDRLTTIPPALSHDESAIAYNAYSIAKTGKDEYGVRFPLLFRSFDDYKLPGMVYSTIPGIVLFGRSELAARLPSSVFGTLAILLMYGISIELLGKKRFLSFGKISFDAAIFPTCMLAVSPWHVNFSRQLFESNGAVFWFMLGTYFLLRSLKKYSNVVLGGISYAIALYFYYSVRLVIPFVALLYLILNWKMIWKEWKTTSIALLIALALFLPMGKEMLSKGGMERISMVSVTNDPNYLKLRDEYVQKLGVHPTLVQNLIYNRRLALVQTALENYGKNISFHNLFVSGTGTFGALYKFELILIIFGLISLWSLAPLSRGIILTWLVTAFLPGAFSINQPNTLRTLIAAPAFAILSGLGIIYVLKKSSTAKATWPIVLSGLVLIGAFLFEFPKFHYAYFVDNPTHNALAFGDGEKQMVQYVTSHESAYDRIYVSGYYWRPYVFFLYWGGIDPTDYQRAGFREHYKKYYFSAASWDTNGMKFMNPAFDFKALQAPSKTLFILAYPEYLVHKKQFRKITEINGRHAKHPFVAAYLE